MIKSDTASLPGYAALTSSVTGRLIGGRVIAHHEDGEVTIAFAGSLHRRGKPLTSADIVQIEARTAARLDAAHA